MIEALLGQFIQQSLEVGAGGKIGPPADLKTDKVLADQY
jgi:hypothetical protein